MINKKNLKFGLLIIIIISLILISIYTPVGDNFSIEKVNLLIKISGSFGILIFIAIYILVTVLMLPGTPFTILAGALFGTFFGTLWVVIGATIGASIAFFIAKWLGHDFCHNLLKDKFTKLMSYNEQMEHKGLIVTLFLRFIPLFPFNGLNFGLGLTKLKFKDYFLGTLIGIIPGTTIFVYSGTLLTQDFDPLKILFVVVLIIILMSLVPIYNWHKKRKMKVL